jgi:hypothetical protein
LPVVDRANGNQMQWESDILSLPLEEVDMVLQGREGILHLLLQGLCFDPTAPRLAVPFLLQGRGDCADVVLVFFEFRQVCVCVCLLALTQSDAPCRT